VRTRPRVYLAMHFSAKRGLTIACRPFVCPSVTLVDFDHIICISWKLIARTISPQPWLFVAKRRSAYAQGNMGKFWGDGWGKVAYAAWRTKAEISLKTRKDREKVTMDDL